LAKISGWTLLMGDGPLRELAKAEGVDCHGVLWLLDEFETGVRGELPRTRCKMLAPARYITPSSQNWSVKPFAARVVGHRPVTTRSRRS
jgi:hypothetical protein